MPYSSGTISPAVHLHQSTAVELIVRSPLIVIDVLEAISNAPEPAPNNVIVLPHTGYISNVVGVEVAVSVNVRRVPASLNEYPPIVVAVISTCCGVHPAVHAAPS